VFKLDLQARKVLRGTDDPIGFGDLTTTDGMVLETGPSGVLFVASFNNDKVYALDTGTDLLAAAPFQSVDVGKTAQMEGPVDLLYRAGATPDLFALLTMSNAIAAITTAAGAAGVQNDFATTGVYGNRLALWGDTLLIVNSGDNNVTGVKLATPPQDLGPLAVLPQNTNPYDVAVGQEGGKTVGYVTGLMSNSLFVVDLAQKQVLAEIK